MTINGATYAGSSTGFRYAGGGSNLGNSGAQLSGAHEQTITRVQTRGLSYGGAVAGGQYAQPTAGTAGSVYGTATPDIDTLLDVDSFALVLERGDDARRRFTVEEPNQSIQSVSIAIEVNTKSDWRIEVPPSDDLYDWSFSRAVIGYNGQRIFHGVLLPVESGYGESVTLGGFGPLWWATHGRLEVTYPDDHPDYSPGQDIPAWEAIQDVWRRTARRTDGRVRGFSLRPSPENKRIIPGSGESFEGTPLSVIKRIHGYAGMAFSIDHTDPSSTAVSFVPGEERRASAWLSSDHSVDIDPSDYINRVVCWGADAPSGYPYNRYRGVAEASSDEIDAVAHGEIIEHNMDAPDLSSPLACEEQAQSKLDELRGNFSLTGTVECSPTNITPGYVYRVPEFDTAAPDIFAPVSLPLQSLEHSYGIDEALTTLKFETEDGVVEAIRDQFTPDTSAYDVIRQALTPGEDPTPGTGEAGLDIDLDLNLDQ